LPVHVDMGTQVDEPTIAKEEEPQPLTQFSKPVEEQPTQIPPPQPAKHKSSRAESKREAADPSKPRAWSSVVGGVTSGGLPGQNNVVSPISEHSPALVTQELATEEEIVTTPAASTAVTTADKPKAAARPEVLNSLYVSNLGAGCDIEEIKDLFSRYGKVKTIKYTSPQSYCFVDYADSESADKALKGGPIKLGDYDLKLERRKTPTFSNIRGRGGRGGRGGGSRGRGGPPRDSRPEPRTTDRTERREPRGDARPREGNDRRPPNKEDRGDRGGRTGRGRGARGAPPAVSS